MSGIYQEEARDAKYLVMCRTSQSMKNNPSQYASSALWETQLAWLASALGCSWLEEDGGHLQPSVHMTTGLIGCLATQICLCHSFSPLLSSFSSLCVHYCLILGIKW